MLIYVERRWKEGRYEKRLSRHVFETATASSGPEDSCLVAAIKHALTPKLTEEEEEDPRSLESDVQLIFKVASNFAEYDLRDKHAVEKA